LNPAATPSNPPHRHATFPEYNQGLSTTTPSAFFKNLERLANQYHGGLAIGSAYLPRQRGDAQPISSQPSCKHNTFSSAHPHQLLRHQLARPPPSNASALIIKKLPNTAHSEGIPFGRQRQRPAYSPFFPGAYHTGRAAILPSASPPPASSPPPRQNAPYLFRARRRLLNAFLHPARRRDARTSASIV